MSRLRRVFYVFLCLWAATLIWHQVKPMPQGTVAACDFHPLEEDQIKFLADLTYSNTTGQRVNDQVIFDTVFQMIDAAESFIVLDFFLINQFKGKATESYRNLSLELVEHLIQRKQQRPELQVVFITDPINTIYGGRVSPLLSALQQADIDVVLTDLDHLRDSNPIYSALWRVLLQWFGNDPGSGWMPNPFQTDGKKITLRSWLTLLNFKANHRKLIVVGQQSGQVSALVTSANPHDASSAHSNVALQVQGNAAIALLQSELAIARFSGWRPRQPFSIPTVSPAVHGTQAAYESACITEIKIRDHLLDWFQQAGQGDSIDIAVFYLAERKVIESLVDAANRGVKVRLILDANKDAFGRKKKGIPNRSVAGELVSAGNGNIQVRWYETRGEQFHSKLAMVNLSNSPANRLYVTLGSANFTRRNIANYNLEANLAVSMPADSKLATDIKGYFETIWQNRSGLYTVDYKNYTDNSQLHYLQYRLMEATGLSSF